MTNEQIMYMGMESGHIFEKCLTVDDIGVTGLYPDIVCIVENESKGYWLNGLTWGSATPVENVMEEVDSTNKKGLYAFGVNDLTMQSPNVDDGDLVSVTYKSNNADFPLEVTQRFIVKPYVNNILSALDLVVAKETTVTDGQTKSKENFQVLTEFLKPSETANIQ